MPVLEISEETYNKILEDIKTEKESGGSLARFSGKWNDIPDKKVKKVKNKLRKLRDKSLEHC